MSIGLLNKSCALFLCLLLLVLSPSPSFAQEKSPPNMPPAPVVVAEVRAGEIQKEAEFVGTVHYPQVSDVAAEVRGMVQGIHFEEGERVRTGKVLVTLDSVLLEKEMAAKRAKHEEVLAELQNARLNLERTETLHKKGLIAAQAHDENRYGVMALEKKAASLKAELEGLQVEFGKKAVRAPFDGVVVKKKTDRGEWLDPGKPVATIARDDFVDIVVDVPEEVLRSLKRGMPVAVMAAGGRLTGKFHAVVPRGDVQTRTFPVKIRAANKSSLIEGMEARVTLPRAETRKTLIVPRDAVITKFGKTVVFAVSGDKARMIPVVVSGYRGGTAGVEADALAAGMKVVVKGNERLQDGQTVKVSVRE